MEENKNYAGIPDSLAYYDNASIVLIPVPYDGTSTWGKGADMGPEAFLDASANMELYDIETGSEVYNRGIHLTNPILEKSSPEAVVAIVEEQTKKHIDAGKFVTLFGGEHSISIGSIRAFNKSFENLSVLQIDAHADLRKEYMGSSCNHACAVYEANQMTNLIQVGIRSMDVEENEVMKRENVFFAHDIHGHKKWMQTSIDRMTDNVFITFDLDAFDPSVLPGTGTPEPGGMLWYETLEFLRMVFEQKNVVGFDIVELLPIPNNPSSQFAAAKLYYKMLTYKFEL